MDPKGYVLINQEFIHTKRWPSRGISFLNGEVTDLEKEYKEALAGKLVVVIDVAVGNDGYLVLGENSKGGKFLWTIEKADTKAFLPIIKKNGILMPAGLSPMEEFEWIVKSQFKTHKDGTT